MGLVVRSLKIVIRCWLDAENIDEWKKVRDVIVQLSRFVCFASPTCDSSSLDLTREQVSMATKNQFEK